MKSNQGFSYLAAMAAIVVIGIALSASGYQWKILVKREKEKELLFRGHQIRSAILQYVNSDPLKRYPHSMEDLVKDPRSAKTVRYLRKLYKDPINNEDWALVMDPARGLLGVHSKSDDEPIKNSNFNFQDRCFDGKSHYREWIFWVPPGTLFAPPAASPNNAPGIAGAAISLAALICPPVPSSPEEEHKG